MKKIVTFEDFINESSSEKVKYVWWQLYSRDNRKVESCSVTFHNILKYHSSISRPMEQRHPKLFDIVNGVYKRTSLALSLGIIDPSDSYSLTCALENKIPNFLQFWENEGYDIIYDEPSRNEELFEKYIIDNNLSKFAKNRIV